MHTQVSQLVGLRAWGGHLAADMLTIQFGEEQTVIQRSGPNKLGQFALHIQSPWRIAKKGTIVVAQQVYLVADGDDEIHADWDTVALLLPDVPSVTQDRPTAKTVTVEPPAGFLMTLDNDMSIQVFPSERTTDRETEAWRIFEPGRDNRHFVVMSDGSHE